METMRCRKIEKEKVQFYAAELVSGPVNWHLLRTKVIFVGGGPGFLAQEKCYTSRRETR